MKVVFCCDPFDVRKPDPAYEAEVAAVNSLALDYDLVSYEALVYEGDPARAVRRVAEQPGSELAVYRGWMLKPEQYKQLYDALSSKGLSLINTPTQYIHCHYLPESYKVIEGYTPRSVWVRSGRDIDIVGILELLQPFGSSPIIVKDFVKSRKHEWEEACYIPSASDRESVDRVVRRFVELQGEDLNEGLVFREFVQFEALAQHSRSGMPLTVEYRIFFLDGEPFFWAEYWEEGDYAGGAPPIEQFREVGKAVQSRLFTMDIAKRPDGEWMIVELGDGQVAGLPERAEVTAFYEALVNQLPRQ